MPVCTKPRHRDTQKNIGWCKVKSKASGFCGGTLPSGYDIVNGEYVINEKEAPAIRKMFEMYALGKSYDDIMQVLYREGYRKRGNKISSNAIYYLLRNENMLVYTTGTNISILLCANVSPEKKIQKSSV